MSNLWLSTECKYSRFSKNNNFTQIWVGEANKVITVLNMGFPGGSDIKKSACHVGDQGSIPGWEYPLEKGTATHSSISCLENSTDRGAWQATVHGVAESWTWLSD